MQGMVGNHYQHYPSQGHILLNRFLYQTPGKPVSTLGKLACGLRSIWYTQRVEMSGGETAKPRAAEAAGGDAVQAWQVRAGCPSDEWLVYALWT